jgi:hypothetical protein
MDKKEIKKMINNLQEVGLLSKEESTTYLEIIDSSEDLSIELVENMISEVAIQRGTIESDIDKLARMLQFTTDKSNVNEEVLFIMMGRPDILNITNLELYKIKEVLYHFVIGVEYNDNNYSFGYNSTNGGFSYKINDSNVSWFNLPKEFIGDPIPHIKDLIIDIMEIDTFE